MVSAVNVQPHAGRKGTAGIRHLALQVLGVNVARLVGYAVQPAKEETQLGRRVTHALVRGAHRDHPIDVDALFL